MADCSVDVASLLLPDPDMADGSGKWIAEKRGWSVIDEWYSRMAFVCEW